MPFGPMTGTQILKNEDVIAGGCVQPHRKLWMHKSQFLNFEKINSQKQTDKRKTEENGIIIFI